MTHSLVVKFDEKIYNVQPFLRDHPGGKNTLKKYQGKSITHAMEKYGHSPSAYHMLKDFEISVTDFKDENFICDISEKGRIITHEEVSRDLEEIKLLEELEGRLDWSKPIFGQLEAIAPHYDKWVHTAVYKPCRLFASPLLESLTYTPWYMVPVFWTPIILYLGITQYLELVACEKICQLTKLQYSYHFVKGIFIWSIFEYVMHRWVFHLSPGSSLTMIKLHFLIHGIHHKVPFDGLRQVFPPAGALFLTVIVYAIACIILAYPKITIAGALLGYLVHDMIHYYVHHGSPKAGSYLYTMKRYHSNHHFINHDKAYGITSKLWDYIFKTVTEVKILGFSLQW